MHARANRSGRRFPRPSPTHPGAYALRALRRVAASAMIMVASAGRHFTVMANDGSVTEVPDDERTAPST